MTHDEAFAQFQARREAERAGRSKVTWRKRGTGWIGGMDGQARIFARPGPYGFVYGLRPDNVIRGAAPKLHEAKRAAEALL